MFLHDEARRPGREGMSLTAQQSARPGLRYGGKRCRNANAFEAAWRASLSGPDERIRRRAGHTKNAKDVGFFIGDGDDGFQAARLGLSDGLRDDRLLPRPRSSRMQQESEAVARCRRLRRQDWPLSRRASPLMSVSAMLLTMIFFEPLTLMFRD
jgi:hypothetical protein